MFRFTQNGIRGREAVDELAVAVYVRLPQEARRHRTVHAVQGDQASDGERSR